MNECQHCGHQNESFFKFCLACGADLTSLRKERAAEPKGIEVPRTVVVQRQAAALSADTVEVPVLEEDDVSPAAAAAVSKKPREDDAPLPADTEVVPGEPRGGVEISELSWERLDQDIPALTPPPVEVAPGPTGPPLPTREPPTVRPGASALTQDALPPAAPKAEGPTTRKTQKPGPPRLEAELPAPPVSPPRRCPGCGSPSPLAHAFCGQCGYRFEDRPAAQSRSAPSTKKRKGKRAELIVIKDDGTDGKRFDLYEGVNGLGRNGPDMEFPDDVFLDPHHADLQIEGDLVTVTDRGSLNGTFVRITEPALVEHGDTFRLGQELLRYEDIERSQVVVSSPNDDTELLGSPVPEGVWGRLVQVVSPDIVGNAYLLSGRFVTVGRERGDITFPGDGYVSGRHATLTRRGGALYLEDLDSSNGTYVRIKGSAAIFDGDLLLLGQQLFRVAI